MRKYNLSKAEINYSIGMKFLYVNDVNDVDSVNALHKRRVWGDLSF